VGKRAHADDAGVQSQRGGELCAYAKAPDGRLSGLVQCIDDDVVNRDNHTVRLVCCSSVYIMLTNSNNYTIPLQ